MVVALYPRLVLETKETEPHVLCYCCARHTGQQERCGVKAGKRWVATAALSLGLLSASGTAVLAVTPASASCMGNYASNLAQASAGAVAAGEERIIDFANLTGVTPGSLSSGEAQVHGCTL